MKKSLLFVAILSCYAYVATAQDLIVKTNAEELQVKVVNVGEK